MEPLSLYIHFPFCVRRCTYCDFNTYSGMNSWIPSYVKALCDEITWLANQSLKNDFVHTIFFGGGTPSLLDLSHIEYILATIRSEFNVSEDAEITLEANPGTLSLEFLRGLHQLGVNRLSIGMQSASPNDLLVLGRIHQFSDVISAMSWARRAGFRNINLDLIFGIPGQSGESWARTVEFALGLRPDHISLYSLTIEEGTPLHSWWKKGLIIPVEDDQMAERYEFAQKVLDQAGFVQYEISNWAASGSSEYPKFCRHNLQYWHNLPYLGVGAGAHSFYNKFRFNNIPGIVEYITRMNKPDNSLNPASPAGENVIEIDRWNEIEETMMLGLRLVKEGVEFKTFSTRFGMTPEEVFHSQIQRLIKRDLLEKLESPKRALRLTPKAYLLGNQVFMEFVGNPKPKGIFPNNQTTTTRVP